MTRCQTEKLLTAPLSFGSAFVLTIAGYRSLAGTMLSEMCCGVVATVTRRTLDVSLTFFKRWKPAFPILTLYMTSPPRTLRLPVNWHGRSK